MWLGPKPFGHVHVGYAMHSTLNNSLWGLVCVLSKYYETFGHVIGNSNGLMQTAGHLNRCVPLIMRKIGRHDGQQKG